MCGNQLLYFFTDISNLRSPEAKNRDLKSVGDITADQGFIPPEIR